MSDSGSLEYPNQMFLDAAVGWVGLGNFEEAERELDRIDPALARHPDILEVRWEVLARRRRWEAALSVAELLVDQAPERCSGWLHRSYCLHELKRTLEAWNRLLPAFSRFRKEATVPYNLACYACQLGNLDQAHDWLEKAVAVSSRDEIRSLALRDNDLLPLAPTLEAW